jgi:hypothetical protein
MELFLSSLLEINWFHLEMSVHILNRLEKSQPDHVTGLVRNNFSTRNSKKRNQMNDHG